MALTREAHRMYYCAAMQAIAGMPGDTGMKHRRALDLVELAMGEEEARFRSEELTNEQLYAELKAVTAERDALRTLAEERAAECRAKEQDLLTVQEAYEQLAVLLWPESDRPDLFAPFSELFGRLLGRLCGIVEAARSLEHTDDEVNTLRALQRQAVPVPRLESLLEEWETLRNGPDLSDQERRMLVARAGDLAVLILEQGAVQLSHTLNPAPEQRSHEAVRREFRELGERMERLAAQKQLEGPPARDELHWHAVTDKEDEGWLETASDETADDYKGWKLLVSTNQFRIEWGSLSLECDAKGLAEAKREARELLKRLAAWNDRSGGV